jgi:hypothetical protein
MAIKQKATPVVAKKTSQKTAQKTAPKAAAKPVPKISLPGVRGVISDLKKRNEELNRKYESAQADIAAGATIGQRGVGEYMDRLSREIDHNDSKIQRYGKVVAQTDIAIQEKSLNQKKEAFNRDYPLAPTFKQNQK